MLRESATTHPLQEEGVLRMYMSDHMYAPPITIQLPMNQHPTLGFQFSPHADSAPDQMHLIGCQGGTAASRIPSWRSKLRFSTLRKVNGTRIHTIGEYRTMLTQLRHAGHKTIHLEFARVDVRSNADDDIPHLHFNQLRHSIHTIRAQMVDDQNGQG